MEIIKKYVFPFTLASVGISYHVLLTESTYGKEVIFVCLFLLLLFFACVFSILMPWVKRKGFVTYKHCWYADGCCEKKKVENQQKIFHPV